MGRALWSPQRVYQLRDRSSLSVLLVQVRFYIHRTPATSATYAYVGGPLPRVTSDARIRTARNKRVVYSHSSEDPLMNNGTPRIQLYPSPIHTSPPWHITHVGGADEGPQRRAS